MSRHQELVEYANHQSADDGSRQNPVPRQGPRHRRQVLVTRAVVQELDKIYGVAKKDDAEAHGQAHDKRQSAQDQLVIAH